MKSLFDELKRRNNAIYAITKAIAAWAQPVRNCHRFFVINPPSRILQIPVLRFLTICLLLIAPMSLFAATSTTLSDLAGTWYLHELGGGPYGWWAHFTMQINSNGSFTSTDFLNSAGETTGPTGVISMSTNGVISVSSQGISQMHGNVSLDKNLVVVTSTQPNGPALGILQRAGATVTLSDLQGTWYLHDLGTGPNSWWSHFTMQINSDGSFTSSNFQNSANETTGPSGTISVSPSGVISVTAQGVSLMHGTVSLDKNLVVVTSTQSNGPELGILQRAGATVTLSDLKGSWFQHELGGGTNSWWAHFSMHILSDGSFLSSNFQNNTGDTLPPGAPSGTLSISTNGALSVSGVQGVSQMDGNMSLDKNLIVFTSSETDGPALGVLLGNGGTYIDTDGDGVVDYIEIQQGRNPLVNEPVILLLMGSGNK